LAVAALILAAIPIWAKPNISALAHQCSLGQQDACAKLTKIALDPHSSVQSEAIRALADKSVLAKIAIDQSVLVKVAEAACDPDIWYETLKMLTDQALLAKIAEIPHNPLAEIVPSLEDKCSEPHPEAVAGISDQATLAHVALNSNSVEVGYRAARKLSDPTLLAKVLESANDGAREAAVGKLTDQASLASFALHGSLAVRYAAVQSLWDQPALERIASDPWPSYDKLDGKHDMYHDAGGQRQYEDLDFQVRILAAGAILDTSALERVADYWSAELRRADAGHYGPIFWVNSNVKAILDLRRAIETLGIEGRTGRLRILLRREDLAEPWAEYGMEYQSAVLAEAEGEKVRISVETDTRILAYGTWSTTFPRSVPAGGSGHFFVPAPINSQQLIGDLLSAAKR
jgi:hypothetical protein